MGRREIERPVHLDLGTIVRRSSWLGDPSNGCPLGGRTTVFANGVIEVVVAGRPTRYWQIDDDAPTKPGEDG